MGVVVEDRADALASAMVALVALLRLTKKSRRLVGGVADDRDGDRLGGRAGGEGQRAAGGRVVAAGGGRAVGGGVVDRHRLAAGRRQGDGEVGVLSSPRRLRSG